SATPWLNKQDLCHHACQDNKVAILEFFEKVGGRPSAGLENGKPKCSSAFLRALRASGSRSEGFCRYSARTVSIRDLISAIFSCRFWAPRWEATEGILWRRDRHGKYVELSNKTSEQLAML